MISKIQRSLSKFLDVTTVRNFLTGLETSLYGAGVSFRNHFTLLFICIYVATESWVGGPN